MSWIGRRTREEFEALERLARDYEVLFHTSPALLSLVDLEGHFRVLNAAWSRTLGYPLEEFPNRPFLSFVHEEDRERTLEEFRRLLGENAWSIDFRNRYRHRDGSWVDLAWYARSDLDRETIYAIALDVTEEERQRARIERYQRVLERTGGLARVGGWEIDLETMRPLWSNEVFRIHDLPVGQEPPLEETIGFYPEGAPRDTIRRLLGAAVERAEPWDVELPFISAKGRHLWVRTQGEAATQKGQVVRVLGSFQDITDQKRAELDLARYGETLGRLHEVTTSALALDEKIEELLELGLETFGLDLGIVSRIDGDDYEVLYSRARGEAIPRGARFELRDTFCSDVVAADGPLSFHNAGESSFRTHPCYQSLGLEAYIGTPLFVHGERLGTLNFSAKPAREPFSARDHDLVRLIAEWVGNEIGRDLQRARVEKARDEAEAANRAKSLFLANMSHEIRTPMNGVLGMAQLLAETELSGEQRELLATMRASAESLLGVIDDILDVSKVEAGRLEIYPLPFRVRDLVGEAVAIVQTRADERGLRLSVEVAESCPVCLVADAGRVRQILLNYLSNAVKFTEGGRIDLRVDYREGQCLFEVRDTGIGVEPALHDVLFDAFRQADASTTRRYGGSGLGLAICKLLAELMEGEVGMRSTLGEGSVFWFRAPMAACRACDPFLCELEAGPPAGERAHSQLPGLGRVLVVEDNAVNQAVARRMLEGLGAEVTLAANGRDALLLLAEESFDLVLMDCQMPDMDGYETTQRIRANERFRERLPIIAMTAHVLEGERERCLDAGMDAFLAKPIALEELRGLLGRFLRPDPG